MLFTGVDGRKIFSINFNPFSKKWKPAKGVGKKIVAIPSDRCLVKFDKIPEGLKKKELEKFLKTKYGNFKFDYTLRGEDYILVLVRDFSPPEDFLSLDCEIFSLARLGFLLKEKHFQVLDFGKRKTTWVEVKNGSPVLYRVVLKGGDFITKSVAEAFKVSFEDAEKLKIGRGLELEVVKNSVEKILQQIPLKGDLPILLSGGGALLKGLEEIFKQKTLKIDLAEPTYYTALGASLKFVYPNGSPNFGSGGITSKELKAVSFSAVVSILLLLLSLKGMETVKTEFIQHLRLKEKELFEEKFPNLPPVSVLEQLRSFAESGKVSVLPLLEKAFKKLPKGVAIYKLSYNNGRLIVEGEAKEELIKGLPIKEIKKTEKDKVLFKMEVSL